MNLGRNPAVIWEQLRGMGHDAHVVRNTKTGWEVVLNSGDQAAADRDLAAIVAAGPTMAERIEAAARKRGLTVGQLALAFVTQAREEGALPPMWARQALKALRDEVQAEL